ncbi:MAG: putative amino acid transporter [Pseudonocardiales bacterium]|nr:putative amino acid transporter [Pseudonocardiales bacterium]
MRPVSACIRSSRGVLIGLAVIPLLVTACSSSKSTSGSSAGASGSSADAILGTPNKATGSPITIGISDPGKEQAIDTTTEFTASRALAKYANDYLGGINGHVIQLKECSTLDTPANELDCANQMIQAKVSAVVEASGDDVTIKNVTAGGIPMMEGLGASTVALQTPNSFSLGNGLGVYGAPAAYAKQKNISNTALIVIDVPGASGPAKQLSPAFFANAGKSVDVVTIAPGVADMSPQIQTTLSKQPGLYYIIGNPAFCTSAIKAIKTLAPTATIAMLNNCISTTKTGITGGYAGIKTVTTQAADPSDPDYKLFLAVQKKYDGATDPMAVFGYVPLLGLIRSLNAAKVTDISATGVTAAIKSAPAAELPLGKGATFKCDGTALPTVSKNICSLAAFVADTDESGALSNFTLLDDPSIYKLG